MVSERKLSVLHSRIGEKLKKTRKEKNLTLEKLSKLSGIPLSTIWKYENQKVEYSLIPLLRMAEAMGKSLEYLLESDDEEKERISYAERDDGVAYMSEKEGWQFQTFTKMIAKQTLYVGILTIRQEGAIQENSIPEGEIFLRGQEGTLEVKVDGKTHTVSKDYCLQFKTDSLFSLRCSGKQEAKIYLSATRFPFKI
jgi:transcriptional regulator with XRE-family HTH domain